MLDSANYWAASMYAGRLFFAVLCGRPLPQCHPPVGCNDSTHRHSKLVVYYMQGLLACVYTPQSQLNTFLWRPEFWQCRTFFRNNTHRQYFFESCKYMVSIVRNPILNQSWLLSALRLHVFELAHWPSIYRIGILQYAEKQYIPAATVLPLIRYTRQCPKRKIQVVPGGKNN